MTREATLQGTVRDLGAAGDGVVEDQSGKVWFVRGSLPGDEISFRPLRRGREAPRRGRLLSLLAPNPDRVAPFCEHHLQCGGCASMAWHPDAEQTWKIERISRALGLDASSVSWFPSPQKSYRIRARLAFEAPERLGYRSPRSRRVVDIPQCPVLVTPLWEGLSHLRETLLPTLTGNGELMIAVGHRRRLVFRLESDAPQPPEAFRATERLVSGGDVAGAELLVGGATKAASFGDPRAQLRASDGKPLVIPPAHFSQANETVNQALQDLVAAWAEPEGKSILELYAGAGNLTVPLAVDATAITTVESNADLVAAARENLACRDLDVQLITADATRFPSGHYDVVVLDPPRSGAQDILTALAVRPPPRIIYVSCHVGTLSRDSSSLETIGYTIDRAAALDMFPQTAHVETVVQLSRSSNGS